MLEIEANLRNVSRDQQLIVAVCESAKSFIIFVE